MTEHTPMKILESLTPGGSEFVDDPERCARYIRDLIDSGHQAKKDRARLMQDKTELLKTLDMARLKFARIITKHRATEQET